MTTTNEVVISKLADLVALNLTKAQAEVLRDAAKREAPTTYEGPDGWGPGYINEFGMRSDTYEALESGGYIHRDFVLPFDERVRIFAARDDDMRSARERLQEWNGEGIDDHTDEARRLLNAAYEATKRANRTAAYLTERGWAVARAWIAYRG